MIRLSLTRADATVTETETLTAGRVGLECAFTFNADWDGLQKVAVFEGAEAVEVALRSANVAVVPPECMATAGYNLRCGVCGFSTTGAVVIPTVWAKAGKIKDSPDYGDEIAPATPQLVAQIIAKANQAEETANSVKAQAEKGEFNGYSPYVAVTDIPGGHRVTITDSVGTSTFDVLDGEDGTDGTDGVSPTIAVSDITGGHVLTITDKNGTRTVNVLNGEDGADGYSPTVAITDITGGHRVTITDANGAHSFDVMDGQGGSGGSSNVLGGYNVGIELWSSVGGDSGYIVDVSDVPGVQVNDWIVGGYLNGLAMFRVEGFDSGDPYGTSLVILRNVAVPTKTSELTNDSGFYVKPSSGIPKSDLASAVQTSLGKADSALQSFTETDPTVPSWAKASSKPSYTASEVGAIAKPSSPTSGQYLAWNGTAWVAQSLPIYNGGVT
jgi:hypothetical protein